ncbi:MAG: hypothetical protein AB1744_12665 [Candidatus Zixiibacteriota bacterium]
MPQAGNDDGRFPDDLRLLDDLIRRYYRELLCSIDKNVKLGDFIKMIELRRKLAPGDTEQKQFWKMLERIRREELKRSDDPRKSDRRTFTSKRSRETK